MSLKSSKKRKKKLKFQTQLTKKKFRKSNLKQHHFMHFLRLFAALFNASRLLLQMLTKWGSR